MVWFKEVRYRTHFKRKETKEIVLQIKRQNKEIGLHIKEQRTLLHLLRLRDNVIPLCTVWILEIIKPRVF